MVTVEEIRRRRENEKAKLAGRKPKTGEELSKELERDKTRSRIESRGSKDTSAQEDARLLRKRRQKAVGALTERGLTEKSALRAFAQQRAGEVEGQELAGQEKAITREVQEVQAERKQARAREQTPEGLIGIDGDVEGDIAGTVTPITPEDVLKLTTFATVGKIALSTGKKVVTDILTKRQAGAVMTPAMEATAMEATKKGSTGVFNKIWTKANNNILKTAGSLFALQKVIGLPSREISSITSQLVEQRERIPNAVSGVISGAISGDVALERLDELRDASSEARQAIKRRELVGELTAFDSELAEKSYAKITKIGEIIDNAEAEILRSQLTGSTDNLDLALIQFQTLLDSLNE